MAGGEPGHPPERKKGEVGCQLPHRKKERKARGEPGHPPERKNGKKRKEGGQPGLSPKERKKGVASPPKKKRKKGGVGCQVLPERKTTRI